jgi:putative aminopeptidase FrvX
MKLVFQRIRFAIGALVALFLALQVHGNPAQMDVHIGEVSREEVEARLRSFSLKDPERETILRSLFQQVGCRDQNLSEQPVKHQKLPNLICVLPGSSDSEIIVGAHFDHVSAGSGVVDNWSGAALLASFFQTLNSQPRKHTFVFIAFTAEESGLHGSEFYTKQLTPDQIAKIRGMVNLDSLGMGPTEIWLHHSDHHLADLFYGVAKTMGLPVGVVNADEVGDEDSSSFKNIHVPTLMLHSVTQDNFPVLHSRRDDIGEIHMADYYGSYRLISTYLAYLDSKLD